MMMNNFKTMILLGASTVLTAGCDLFDDDDIGVPAAETYTATVTSVDVVNKDSGEMLVIEGFPVEGGVLTVE